MFGSLLSVFGGFTAEVLMYLLGAILNKRKQNIESKENFHKFVESWQKEKSNLVSEHDHGKEILSKMDNDKRTSE